jgi:hypothetical protein
MLIHYNGLLIIMIFKININGVLKAQVANLRQQEPFQPLGGTQR